MVEGWKWGVDVKIPYFNLIMSYSTSFDSLPKKGKGRVEPRIKKTCILMYTELFACCRCSLLFRGFFFPLCFLKNVLLEFPHLFFATKHHKKKVNMISNPPPRSFVLDYSSQPVYYDAPHTFKKKTPAKSVFPPWK